MCYYSCGCSDLDSGVCVLCILFQSVWMLTLLQTSVRYSFRRRSSCWPSWRAHSSPCTRLESTRSVWTTNPSPCPVSTPLCCSQVNNQCIYLYHWRAFSCLFILSFWLFTLYRCLQSSPTSFRFRRKPRSSFVWDISRSRRGFWTHAYKPKVFPQPGWFKSCFLIAPESRYWG